MSADHEVRRAHRRKTFRSVGGCIAPLSLSHTEKHAVHFAYGCRLPFAFGKVFFFCDESYFEVREVDSVYMVSQARGRETRRTMSGGVVRSFLVEFVTGQAISAQFFF